MKKIILSIAVFLFSILGIQLNAQNLEADAIKFGTTNQDGTARAIAVGGAISAIGADVTNFAYNPSGIAVYNSTVFVFSPSLEINKSDAVFTKSSFQRQNIKFNFSNIGAVINIKNEKFGVFDKFNFGISLNTTNSFNQENQFKRNTDNTITNKWLSEIVAINGNVDNSVTYDDFSFEAVGAYYSYLVNYDTSLSAYTTPITNSIFQRSLTTTKGGKRDLNLALGTSLFDKLFIGASVSIPFINYQSAQAFYEEDRNDINGEFEDFSLSNKYKNSGTGINVGLGLTYKPVDFLRISAAIKSGTRFRMEEEYTSDFETNYETVRYIDSSSLGKFEYSFSTPWTANAGLALVHKKLGFISFDYELTDFASTQFIMDSQYDDLETSLNRNIKDKYQIAHTFKVGVEAKIKQFRIRAGYNMQTSPLKESFREGSNDFSRQQFSGGVGYLWKKVSLDAAYRYSLSKEYELSYDGINGIYKNTDRQLFVVSLGFKLGR